MSIPCNGQDLLKHCIFPYFRHPLPNIHIHEDQPEETKYTPQTKYMHAPTSS